MPKKQRSAEPPMLENIDLTSTRTSLDTMSAMITDSTLLGEDEISHMANNIGTLPPPVEEQNYPTDIPFQYRVPWNRFTEFCTQKNIAYDHPDVDIQNVVQAFFLNLVADGDKSIKPRIAKQYISAVGKILVKNNIIQSTKDLRSGDFTAVWNEYSYDRGSRKRKAESGEEVPTAPEPARTGELKEQSRRQYQFAWKRFLEFCNLRHIAYDDRSQNPAEYVEQFFVYVTRDADKPVKPVVANQYVSVVAKTLQEMKIITSPKQVRTVSFKATLHNAMQNEKFN